MILWQRFEITVFIDLTTAYHHHHHHWNRRRRRSRWHTIQVEVPTTTKWTTLLKFLNSSNNSADFENKKHKEIAEMTAEKLYLHTAAAAAAARVVEYYGQ